MSAPVAAVLREGLSPGPVCKCSHSFLDGLRIQFWKKESGGAASERPCAEQCFSCGIVVAEGSASASATGGTCSVAAPAAFVQLCGHVNVQAEGGAGGRRGGWQRPSWEGALAGADRAPPAAPEADSRVEAPRGACFPSEELGRAGLSVRLSAAPAPRKPTAQHGCHTSLGV